MPLPAPQTDVPAPPVTRVPVVFSCVAVFGLDRLDLPAALLGADEGARLREMHHER